MVDQRDPLAWTHGLPVDHMINVLLLSSCLQSSVPSPDCPPSPPLPEVFHVALIFLLKTKS